MDSLLLKRTEYMYYGFKDDIRKITGDAYNALLSSSAISLHIRAKNSKRKRRERFILKYLSIHPAITVAQLAKLMKCQKQIARRIMNDLTEENKLKKINEYYYLKGKFSITELFAIDEKTKNRRLLILETIINNPGKFPVQIKELISKDIELNTIKDDLRLLNALKLIYITKSRYYIREANYEHLRKNL